MRPIDFNAIRIALVREVERATEVTCVMAQPETQRFPRPPRPYMTMFLVTPAQKVGDDASTYVSAGVWNVGGQRCMIVDFNAYGRTHEEAYEIAAAWQSALEMETTQTILRKAGIAVWLNGSIADMSELLQTGYEGRAKIEVQFGIAANVTEDRGAIETAQADGTMTTDQGKVVQI